jgi:hypothetical protein
MKFDTYLNSTPSAFGTSPKSETEIEIIIQTAHSDLGEAGRGL